MNLFEKTALVFETIFLLILVIILSVLIMICQLNPRWKNEARLYIRPGDINE